MTDPEALAAALALIETWLKPEDNAIATVVAAATKYLAQLPEKCPEPDCDKGILKFGSQRNWTTHASCNATGKVYPAELVERIAVVLYNTDLAHRMGNVSWLQAPAYVKARYLEKAVAVLDALNETP